MLKTVALLSLVSAPSVYAQVVRGPRTPIDTITVNRNALTISIPIDSAIAGQVQEIVPGVNLALTPSPHDSTGAVVFDIPASEVRAGIALHPAMCRSMNNTRDCRDSTTLEVARNRLIVTVRDSFMIARMFGDRSAVGMYLETAVWRARRGRPVARFTAPGIIPLPGNERLAFMAEPGLWGPWSPVLTTVRLPPVAIDTVWLFVGDRTTVRVAQRHCAYSDLCTIRLDETALSWMLSDTNVATFAPGRDPSRSTATIVAQNPGKSILTIDGLHGATDSMPNATHRPMLRRQVIVTRPIERLEITPRPSTVEAGSRMPFVAHALDATGVIVDVPVNFYVLYDASDPAGWNGQRYDVATNADLTTPGHRRFIAYFGKWSDTLDVEVVRR